MLTVVIIDEYDSAMLNHLHDEDSEKEFYGPLKEFSADLRFVFTQA